MRKLKQIVIERINNMNDLKLVLSREKENDIPHQKKYQLLLQCKKAEKYRSIRQSQLLIALNGLTFSSLTMYQELYDISVQIFTLYDQKYIKFKEKNSVNMNENIRKLYCEFFNSNGFKSKCQYINTLLQKGPNVITPALYLAWLCEWSKKMLCQVLKEQIQQTFSSPDKSFRPIQHSVHVISGLQNKKKNDQSLLQGSATQCLYDLSFLNRANVYGFFIDDLHSYYKTCGFTGVDLGYLKTIRKRVRKQQFLKASNLNKAVETLISVTGNKQISSIMKQYQLQYIAKFSRFKHKEYGMRAGQFTNKMTPLSPIKRRIRNITDGDETKPQSPNTTNKQKLSPKFSEFLFIKPEDIDQKIKKLKIINQRTIRNNIQFPGIIKIETCKNDLKQLISNKSFNIATNKEKQKQKQQPPTSVQIRMKDKKFFRCSSIKVKCKLSDDQQLLEQSLFKSKLKNSSSFQFNSQYDDQNMKLPVSKRFQLSDLRRNIKLAITKKALALQIST